MMTSEQAQAEQQRQALRDFFAPRAPAPSGLRALQVLQWHLWGWADWRGRAKAKLYNGKFVPDYSSTELAALIGEAQEAATAECL